MTQLSLVKVGTALLCTFLLIFKFCNQLGVFKTWKLDTYLLQLITATKVITTTKAVHRWKYTINDNDILLVQLLVVTLVWLIKQISKALLWLTCGVGVLVLSATLTLPQLQQLTDQPPPHLHRIWGTTLEEIKASAMSSFSAGTLSHLW